MLHCTRRLCSKFNMRWPRDLLGERGNLTTCHRLAVGSALAAERLQFSVRGGSVQLAMSVSRIFRIGAFACAGSCRSKRESFNDFAPLARAVLTRAQGLSPSCLGRRPLRFAFAKVALLHQPSAAGSCRRLYFFAPPCAHQESLVPEKSKLKNGTCGCACCRKELIVVETPKLSAT